MYNNPLMVLREYVQNAVDAIEAAESNGILPCGSGIVSVTVDGRHRQIVVEDNGIGVAGRRVATLLGGLGVSAKRYGEARGFRGIGRLGGLGYADEVVFETRSAGQRFVSVVSWSAVKLRTFLERRSGRAGVEAALDETVLVARRPPEKGEGRHFFRVILKGVRRFHRDDLMNVVRMETYLRQVTPVPFNGDEFPFAPEVERHLSTVPGYRSFPVLLNGGKLYRTHRRTIEVSSQRIDEIRGVELFDIPGPNGRRIGRGWYAVTNCLASVPPREAMRGIRVRQGNIEIGDEYFLADCFLERRFATWHIGELHVDYSLRPNARRDGFEEGKGTEALLEHGARLCRHLSRQCRDSSRARSQRARLDGSLERAERALEGALVIDDEHLIEKQRVLKMALEEIEKLAGECGCNDVYQKRLKAAQRATDRLGRQARRLSDLLDGRSLRHVDKKALLQSVAHIIVRHHPDRVAAETLIREVVAPYTKRR